MNENRCVSESSDPRWSARPIAKRAAVARPAPPAREPTAASTRRLDRPVAPSLA